jgi:hypothetical protein
VHFSTLVVMALVAGLLVLANLPARPRAEIHFDFDGDWGPAIYGTDFLLCDHGWPLTHLSRKVEMTYDVDGMQTDPELWTLTAGERSFSVASFLANLAVAAIIVSAGGAIFEWWRRRRRRLFQFHVADCLILTAAAASIGGFIAYERRGYEEELRAIDVIRADLEGTGDPPNRVEGNRGPYWLRQWLGDEHFEIFNRVEGISVDGTAIEPASGLSHLRHLIISTPVPPEKWALLERLACVETLEIIGDRGTSPVDPALVSADPTYATCRLPRLPRLKMLLVIGLGLPKYGQGDLPALEEAAFTWARIEPADMRRLAYLPRLRRLYFSHLSADDAALAQLPVLPSLEELWIEKSDKVTDAIKRLTHLKLLSLYNTKVSSAGVRELERALPNCQIAWPPKAGRILESR